MSSARTPRARMAATTRLIASLLPVLAAAAVGATVETPAVKRASSGLVSARPPAEIWTSTSSRWSPRASGGGLSQAARIAQSGATDREARILCLLERFWHHPTTRQSPADHYLEGLARCNWLTKARRKKTPAEAGAKMRELAAPARSPLQRRDVEHRVGARVDLVDGPPIRAVIDAAAIAIAGAIFIRHATKIGRHPLSDAQAAADAIAAAVGLIHFFIGSALAIIAVAGRAVAVAAIGIGAITVAAIVAIIGAAVGNPDLLTHAT